MKRRDLVVVGGGEHARVVIDAIRLRPRQFRLLGYSDRKAVPLTDARMQTEWLGGDEAVALECPRAFFVLGIGPVPGGIARARALRVFRQKRWANVIHVNATMAKSTRVGEGVVVLAGARVNSGASLGDHVVINTGAIIEHDVQIEEMVHIGPAAAIGGGASIASGAYVGLGALVRDHVTVGRGAVIGMGAVVIRDVPAGATVIGNPARPRRS
jgi:acetyltransferase EpsM